MTPMDLSPSAPSNRRHVAPLASPKNIRRKPSAGTAGGKLHHGKKKAKTRKATSKESKGTIATIEETAGDEEFSEQGAEAAVSHKPVQVQDSTLVQDTPPYLSELDVVGTPCTVAAEAKGRPTVQFSETSRFTQQSKPQRYATDASIESFTFNKIFMHHPLCSVSVAMFPFVGTWKSVKVARCFARWPCHIALVLDDLLIVEYGYGGVTINQWDNSYVHTQHGKMTERVDLGVCPWLFSPLRRTDPVFEARTLEWQIGWLGKHYCPLRHNCYSFAEFAVRDLQVTKRDGQPVDVLLKRCLPRQRQTMFYRAGSGVANFPNLTSPRTPAVTSPRTAAVASPRGAPAPVSPISE